MSERTKVNNHLGVAHPFVDRATRRVLSFTVIAWVLPARRASRSLATSALRNAWLGETDTRSRSDEEPGLLHSENPGLRAARRGGRVPRQRVLVPGPVGHLAVLAGGAGSSLVLRSRPSAPGTGYGEHGRHFRDHDAGRWSGESGACSDHRVVEHAGRLPRPSSGFRPPRTLGDRSEWVPVIDAREK